MGKYEKRRWFRQNRKAGVPFLLACFLSRRGRDSLLMQEPPTGWKREVVTMCECCGPAYWKYTELSTGRSWDFNYWTGLPE